MRAGALNLDADAKHAQLPRLRESHPDPVGPEFKHQDRCDYVREALQQLAPMFSHEQVDSGNDIAVVNRVIDVICVARVQSRTPKRQIERSGCSLVSSSGSIPMIVWISSPSTKT